MKMVHFLLESPGCSTSTSKLWNWSVSTIRVLRYITRPIVADSSLEFLKSQSLWFHHDSFLWTEDQSMIRFINYCNWLKILWHQNFFGLWFGSKWLTPQMDTWNTRGKCTLQFVKEKKQMRLVPRPSHRLTSVGFEDDHQQPGGILCDVMGGFSILFAVTNWPWLFVANIGGCNPNQVT